jgi:hypothetical protein
MDKVSDHGAVQSGSFIARQRAALGKMKRGRGYHASLPARIILRTDILAVVLASSWEPAVEVCRDVGVKRSGET